MNEILLRRRHKLNIQPYSALLAEKDNPEIYRFVIAIAKNIESLGFTFAPDVINVLKTYTRPMLISFYRDDLIPMLDRLCAADVEYRPMYPNFPEQVASASDAELYINAILHYLTSGQWLPEYAQNARMPLIDVDKMTVLTVGSAEDILDIFANLVASKTSLSEQDKEDVRQIMLDYPAYAEHMPDEIPLKENVAMIANTILEINPGDDGSCIAKYFKTATDVLRFIVSLSGGDISLAARTKFKHLRRPERRLIMNLLANCGNITEDLFRYRDEWIRIGEIVHPYKYGPQYAEVRQAFDVLRNHPKPLFRMGRVEEAIKKGDVLTAAWELVARPGEFARRLDKLLRDASRDEQYAIIRNFQAVADQVSTPVLLQLRQAFINRRNAAPKVRVFMPKGKIAKAISIPYNLPEIDDQICQHVIKICERAIAENYKRRDPMGCVYIDPVFRDFIVPFSQRSASSGNKALVRGSRVPIRKDARTVRGFIWWTNADDDSSWDRRRVDLDLSACILDQDFNYMSHISYTNLRDDGFRGYHSGDIIDGGPVNGNGVAEFIDVDIDKVVENGGRYICYQVYSFTRQKFSDLPNCRFGWMEREAPDSGEIFEPKTVEMAIALNSESTVSVPVLFDCLERKFIWMDMSVDMITFHGGNNLESNLTGVRAVAYAIANINKPTLYDLVYLNALARGCVVCDRESADVIFSNDTTKPQIPVYADDYDAEGHIIDYETKDVPVITAFDVDYYMAML